MHFLLRLGILSVVKVRTITALCLAALAEAATPYGIEAFDSVLKPLWKVRSDANNVQFLCCFECFLETSISRVFVCIEVKV